MREKPPVTRQDSAEEIQLKRDLGYVFRTYNAEYEDWIEKHRGLNYDEIKFIQKQNFAVKFYKQLRAAYKKGGLVRSENVFKSRKFNIEWSVLSEFLEKIMEKKQTEKVTKKKNAKEEK